MSGSSPRRRLSPAAVAAGVLLTGLFAVPPEPVRAQGLFDLLSGIMRGARPHAYRNAPRLLDGFPDPGDRWDFDRGRGPHVAYCVRLCDGRYFPLPARGEGGGSPAQLCSALCPASKTEVYFGGDIQFARTDGGQRYAELPRAFTYRERMIADCTCNGRDPTGLARVDPRADPTLRPGDIVVTANGPVVFKGKGNPPHRTGDFVPAEEDRRLPANLRRELANLRIAEESGPATAHSTTTPGASARHTSNDPGLMQGFEPPAEN